MVDRKLVRELLGGIQAHLLHERLAHAMSRAVAEREFAFELAALIEEHVRDVVAIPPFTGAEVGAADLLVLPRKSVVYRADGTLAAPRVWPTGAVAIELAEIRLANGVTASSRSYDAVLQQLLADLTEKSAATPADWIGVAVVTDAAWSDTPARADALRAAHEVKLDRWRPGPEGLRCIGSVFGSMSHRAWRGDVWVDAFLLATPGGSPPDREAIHLPPPPASDDERGGLSSYATRAADGRELDGDGHGPAHLRVETATLHEHRRDQYERLGTWGGTSEELRLCLFMEERLSRGSDDATPFEEVPGVAQLVRELRAAWDAEHRA